MTPKLICLTPVRNEAWCLRTFLDNTSLWADQIIIADQNSTDGSREIMHEYPKVILIENIEKNYNEDIRQKLLINEARKIIGPKILFTLDADEIFSAGFYKTDDWHKILTSNPGDVFGLQWANITSDMKHYFLSKMHFPWIYHDDGITKHEKYVRYIHSMRIPFPEDANKRYYEVNDFKVLHFAHINLKRVESKNRYYQCIVKITDTHDSCISLFRTYHLKKVKTYPIPHYWLNNQESKQIINLEELRISESLFWFDLEVKEIFLKYGFYKFRYLAIWDKKWIEKMKKYIEISDPRNTMIKLIHFYLYMSQNISTYIPIRIMDKLIKSIIK